MSSFRKRVLALIIGLSVVTQTVTLAAVLLSTRRTVEARAAEQLRSGAALAEHLVRFRAGQLANGVAVLAGDFGFREAVASGHVPTILSAARNNALRIGADMVLVLDTHGRVLASSAGGAFGADSSLAGLLADAEHRARRAELPGVRRAVLPVLPGAGACARNHRLGGDGLRGRRRAGAEDPRPGGLAGGDRHPRPRRAARRLHARGRQLRPGGLPGRPGRRPQRAPRRRRLPELRAPPGRRRRCRRPDPAATAGGRARSLSRAARRHAAHRRHRAAARRRGRRACSAAARRARSAS